MKVGIGLPNTIPGTDGALLVEWARRADAGCPFSALVRASATVSVDATLEVA